MELSNQTLTDIVKNVIQASPMKLDYVGWSIGMLGAITGIIAIVITLLIYRKQVKLTSQIDKLRREAISDSLRRIPHQHFRWQTERFFDTKINRHDKGYGSRKIYSC